jgi:EAL domain-containing protein (putative c-di-GMP-specific phosphodiesterase class I)
MYITLQNPSEYFDQTTGLYSRYALDTYMEDCIHDKKQVQVVMVNMKHTNAINKALGITFTNQILRELAATLAAIAGKKNLCFNVTGDIAVILTHEEKEHKRIYEKLHTAFPSIMEIEHKKVEVELHLGSIDTLEGLSNTSEFHEMLRLCNIMSRDKNSKKELTTAELTGIKEYQKAEKNLKDALLFKQILLTLQPIYNSQTKNIIGAEALARIENEEGQLLQPSSFIPIAEDNGLVTELDMQIFANACEALKKINRTNADFTVSVNLAAIDFLSDKIVERIFQIIDKYDIDTQKLVIELTETGASISPMILQVMQRLKAKGIRLAIDDFGIGFANYDAILRLPVDFIKIDRNLLLLCQEQPKYQVILEHLAIALKQVGRLVLIEGIETPEQATLASKMGICLQQGFLYGKPDSIDKMLQLLQ